MNCPASSPYKALTVDAMIASAAGPSATAITSIIFSQKLRPWNGSSKYWFISFGKTK
jgi:hypothetical protein